MREDPIMSNADRITADTQVGPYAPRHPSIADQMVHLIAKAMNQRHGRLRQARQTLCKALERFTHPGTRGNGMRASATLPDPLRAVSVAPPITVTPPPDLFFAREVHALDSSKTNPTHQRSARLLFVNAGFRQFSATLPPPALFFRLASVASKNISG